jgi:hypothetical protein
MGRVRGEGRVKGFVLDTVAGAGIDEDEVHVIGKALDPAMASVKAPEHGLGKGKGVEGVGMKGADAKAHDFVATTKDRTLVHDYVHSHSWLGTTS